MGKLLTRLLQGPHAQEILQELARNIRMRREPMLFAGAFLEILNNESSADVRRDAYGFLLYADTRTWREIVSDIAKHVDKQTLKILRSEKAEEFFGTWKFMVKSQMSAFWQQFSGNRKRGRKAV